MSFILPVNILKLLQEHSFKVTPDVVNENLTCNICRMLAREVYQTHCGCTYCYQCISEYLSNGNKHCNGKKDDCKNELLKLDENVCRSVYLNRKILKAVVFCPNASCLCSSNLVDIENHLFECIKQSIDCPYIHIGCVEECLTKDTIQKHINNETFSHTRLLMDWVDQLKNEFRESKSDIRDLKEHLKLNEDLRAEQAKEIEGLKSDFRNKELEMNKQQKEIDSTKKQLEEQRMEIESIKKGLVNHQENVEDKLNEVDSVKSQIQQQEKGIETVKIKLKDFEQQRLRIESATNNCKEIESQMMEARSRIENLSKFIDDINVRTNMSGEITLKIHRIDHKLTIPKIEIHSPHLYSHRNGYKLRLLLFPGGWKEACGTHLSAYIEICKGPYDDMLSWPCKYVFNLSVTNQLTGRGYNTEILCHDKALDDCKYFYEKPTHGDNNGYGLSTFVSHWDLRSVPGLVVNNCLIVKCTVSPPL